MKVESNSADGVLGFSSVHVFALINYMTRTAMSRAITHDASIFRRIRMTAKTNLFEWRLGLAPFSAVFLFPLLDAITALRPHAVRPSFIRRKFRQMFCGFTSIAKLVRVWISSVRKHVKSKVQQFVIGVVLANHQRSVIVLCSVGMMHASPFGKWFTKGFFGSNLMHRKCSSTVTKLMISSHVEVEYIA